MPSFLDSSFRCPVPIDASRGANRVRGIVVSVWPEGKVLGAVEGRMARRKRVGSLFAGMIVNLELAATGRAGEAVEAGEAWMSAGTPGKWR